MNWIRCDRKRLQKGGGGVEAKGEDRKGEEVRREGREEEKEREVRKKGKKEREGRREEEGKAIEHVE